MAVEIPQNISVLLLGVFIVLIAFVTDRIRCPEYLEKLPRVSILKLFSKRDGDERCQKVVPSAGKTEGIYIEYLGKWIVNVSKPEYAQTILTSPLKYPKILPTLERPSSLIAKFLSINTRHSNASKWLRYSDAITPIFQRPDHVEVVSKLINRRIETWIEKSEKEVDILQCMRQVVLDILCHLIFNQEPDSAMSSLMEYFTSIEQELGSRRYFLLPFLEYIPFVGRPDIHQKVEEMNAILYGIIERKADNLKTYKDSDLISALLSDEQPFTPVEIRDIVFGLIWAGYESMPNTLAAAMYYIAVNPKAQQEARVEALDTLRDQQKVSLAGSMTYLSAIIKETLRMNPVPTTLDTRITKETVQFGDYVLPPNTPITVDTRSLHYDPEIWEDPYSFNPRRFLTTANTNAYEWLAFGGGPRECIGASFSRQHIGGILATILSRFTITLPKGSIHSNGLKLDRDMKPINLKVTLVSTIKCQ
ncbi:hypothetical protein K7432_006724 [Basidiobolus ranarum]|uniref:Cytochrome P450 n=1 Tax=Basidiobolus ranarum TaxID=34480 RepID=A0ABR2WUK7_9FUNG